MALSGAPFMNPESLPSASNKYLREHTPSLDDIIFTRRQFLVRSGMGFGALSLASIFGLNPYDAAAASTTTGKLLSPLAPKRSHFPVKAKSVIHIFAEGGPSHVDTWDPKPELAKYADKTIPGNDGLAYPSPFKFTKMGKAGIEVSEVFPKLGECIDDMAIIRSMWTDIPHTMWRNAS